MKTNQAISILVMTLLSVDFAWAQGNRTEVTKNENVVQQLTGQEKKVRKKKVEMCSECGKPESECECHGHDKQKHKETQIPSEEK